MLVHNFRPTQPIHGRTIRFNKPEKSYWNFLDKLLHKNSAQIAYKKEVFVVTICGILANILFVV